MSELKKCPCGQVPEKLQIVPSNTGFWAYVYGNCCADWNIEFRTKNLRQDSDECMALAVAEWNRAPRAEELK